MVLSSPCNLYHLRHLGLTKFPFWNDPNGIPRLHPVPPSTDNTHGKIEYAPELKELAETMKNQYVETLLGRCPSLKSVSVRRPEMEGVSGVDGIVFKVGRKRHNSRIQEIKMEIREVMPLP